MNDLIEFLKARLDVDAEAAQATERADGPDTLEWRRGGRRRVTFDNGCTEDYESVFTGEWDRILIARDSGALAAHIARHDPARVLRDIKIKRQIISDYQNVALSLAHTDPSGSIHDVMTGAVNTLGGVLRLFTLPYADHPDYREDWRP